MEERLNLLERENRCLKRAGIVALVVIAAVVLMGQAMPKKVVADVVEAKKFVLRDLEGGYTAGLLTTRHEGLVFYFTKFDSLGTKGSLRLNFGPNGDPTVWFISRLGDRAESRTIGLTLPTDGTLGLILTDRFGKVIWSAP